MWLISTILFIVILGLLAFFDTKKPKNYPPGPRWLPILGSTLNVYKLRKETGSLCRAMTKLSKQYGPLVGLKIGKDLTVVVHGTLQIREFLSRDIFNGRPHGLFYEIRTWGKRLGVILTDENLWQEQRRFVLRQLREFGFGRRNMSCLIEEEVAIMVDDLKQKIQINKENCVIQMNDLFGIYILNTLWTMLAGVRYSSDDKELKRLQKILEELLANVDMVGALFSQFPFLRHIAPGFSGYSLYMKTHINIWKFLNEELQNHKASYKPGVLRDFMDVYLTMLNSPDKKDSFTEQQLLAVCLDLFIAGSETTNKTLGFAFLYLLLNPDVQKKAQEEIDSVIGRNRIPTLNDRPSMQYVECVVLESLRMFAGRAFSLPHRALEDTQLQGYFIPKNTMVVANFEGVLMGDDSGRSNPQAFEPERFMQDGHVVVPDSYLPFGFGKHRCMGETLARANLFLFISSLLQNFDFSVPPGSLPPTTECLDGATPAPTPYKALITLRK